MVSVAMRWPIILLLCFDAFRCIDQRNVMIFDHCQLGSLDCGTGRCQWFDTGNRCRCPFGRMGLQCRWPCQDIYQSCKRWAQEHRCDFKITSFFRDSCALSCNLCESDGKQLRHPLPMSLEPLAWLIGRWETEQVQSDVRFPIPMISSSSYNEILEVQLSDASMFDRPTLNYSVVANSPDNLEVHNALGFVAMKPAHETGGFSGSSAHSDSNQVAIAMTNSIGINTIEEGVLKDYTIVLAMVHNVSSLGSRNDCFVPTRKFTLVARGVLEEEIVMVDKQGQQRWLNKRFHQTFDYLRAIDTD